MVSTFESSSLSRSILGKRRRSRTTAAATTGPASGPRPASSTPQTSPAQRRSILKSGMTLSPNRLATRVRARQERTKWNGGGRLKERYLPRVFASEFPITRGNPLSGWRRGVTFLGALGTLLLLALSPSGA